MQFNAKLLVNALYDINIFEPVSYDQTFVFVDQYTPDTSQLSKAAS